MTSDCLRANAKLVDVNVCCPNIKVTFDKVTFDPLTTLFCDDCGALTPSS